MDNSNGVLGRCWTHNYEGHIQEDGDQLFVYHEEGRVEIFCKDTDYFLSEQNKKNIVIKQDKLFCLLMGTREYRIYDSKGHLKVIVTNEMTTLLIYDKERLVRVVNNRGEEFILHYNEKNQPDEVKDHGGRKVRYYYEGEKLTTVEDSDGYKTAYSYGENGRIEKVTDKRGICVVENTYDEYRRIKSQQFPDGGTNFIHYAQEKKEIKYENQTGAVTKYVHDKDCRPVLTEQSGKKLRNRFDQKGRCIQKVNCDGSSISYEYDDNDRITRKKDPLGNEIQYEYDEKNREIHIKERDGSKRVLKYDALFRKTAQINGLGYCTEYHYKGTERKPERILFPDHTCLKLQYDKKGNITAMQQGEHGRFQYCYDSYNRVTESIDANGNSTKYEYDGRNRLKRVIRADEAVKEYQYNGMGEAVQIMDYDQNSMFWEYNEINKPVKYIDKEGRTTQFAYDKCWQVQSVTDPEGEIESYRYDERGCLSELTLKSGEIIRFAYDTNKNRTQIEYPDHSKNEYGYDALNRLIWEKDAAGNLTKYCYDAMDRLIMVEDALKNQTLYRYDFDGNLIEKQSATGGKTLYSYDEMSRIKEIILENERKETYRYNEQGLLEHHDKGDGSFKTYGYDKVGNLIREEDESQNQRKFHYNCLNQVITVIYNERTEKSFCYDTMGRITFVEDGNGNVTHYQYSKQGNLVLMQDALGTRTVYEYNGRDELTGIYRNGETEPEDSRYIRLFRNQNGQITFFEDESREKNYYTYDSMGRVRTRKKVGQTEVFSDFSYDYDFNGNLSQIYYPDGNSILLSYDALNRLQKIADQLGECHFEWNAIGKLERFTDYWGAVQEYDYEPDGSRKWMRYPDGREVTYNRDCIGRLNRITAGSYFMEYCYDEKGRLSHNRMNEGLESLYTYDEKGRLKDLYHKQKDKCLEHLSYHYDEQGEVSELIRECCEDGYGYQRHFTYDALLRVSSVQSEKQKREYQYDAYGDRISDLIPEPIAGNYFLDAQGHVSAFMKEGAILQQNVYDSMGNRVEMENLEAQERHIYTVDYASKNRHIITDQGKKQTDYMWMEDHLIGSPNQGFYVLSDPQGTPLRVVDKKGESINLYRYSIYGEAEKTEEKCPIPFGFAGHVREAEESCYYAGAREYHAGRGRFLSRDNLHYMKKADPMGVNLYAYGNGNPLRYADFNGHESIEEYLTQQEKMEQYGIDRLHNSIYPVDFADWKYDIENFDYRSLDSWITMAANGVSMGTPSLAFLRYLTPKFYKHVAISISNNKSLKDSIRHLKGLIGLDVEQDIKDIKEDFSNKFEPQNIQWWMKIWVDMASVLPIIGEVKYTDERIENTVETGVKLGVLSFAQDVFGKVTDVYYQINNHNTNREEHKKVNDMLLLSQFPKAITSDMYIKDQNELGKYNGYLYADTNASEMGCGPVAVYNCLHATGSVVTFHDVLYGTDIATVGGGANLIVLGEYMEDQGYQVKYLFGDEIDEKSPDYDAVIITCSDRKFNGHYYTMIPTGTCSQKGENLYQFYNGYDIYTNQVRTYEEGVLIPGEDRNLNIHVAIAIKKKEKGK